MKTKSNKLRTSFNVMYTDVMNSEAWKAMTKPIGAKVLLLEMKALYNRKTEAAVPMSVRYAAKPAWDSHTVGWTMLGCA